MGAAAVPIVAALIGTATTIYSTEEQAGIARRAEDSRRNQQQKLEAENAKRAQQAELDLQKNTDLSRKRTTAGVQGGRADTILTSPLGVIGNAPTAAKTLLGA